MALTTGEREVYGEHGAEAISSSPPASASDRSLSSSDDETLVEPDAGGDATVVYSPP